MGVCMARLHWFAREWAVPEGFVRPRWNPEHWIGASSSLWTRGKQVYTDDELAIFDAAARRIRSDLWALGESRDTFGVIHADLAPSNVVFRSGVAQAIDFEECGWGYYQFDIAVSLMALEDYGERGGPLCGAFLEGYRQTSPTPEVGAEFRETFMAIVLIKIVEWVINWDAPTRRPRGADYLAQAVSRLRHFVESDGTVSRGL